MNSKMQNIILISIILILIIGTTILAIKVVNDENNRYILENEYSENSYKLGILGDSVINVLYKNSQKIINIYYYNEYDEFILEKVVLSFENKSNARKYFNEIKGNKQFSDVNISNNIVIYTLKDNYINLSKQNLIEKLRQDYMNTEIEYKEII